MMLSTCDEFKNLIKFIIDQGFLTETDVDFCLKEFGGLSGAIDDEYYISSYELIGRCLVKNNSIENVMEVLNHSGCFSASASQYYFFWAIFDEYKHRGGSLLALLKFTPYEYVAFLEREFGDWQKDTHF